jgi:predicted XRE-type DNA-binding protein
MAGKQDRSAVTEGGPNVFADLGVAQAEEEFAKAQLASHIREAIRRRKLTQAAAAALVGLDQPKISALVNGRLEGFSSDRLLRCLTALGQDVDIVVRAARSRRRGRLRIIGKAA